MFARCRIQEADSFMMIKRFVQIFAAVLAAAILCSCSKPEAGGETPPPGTSAGTPAPGVSASPTPLPAPPGNVSDEVYDAYTAARKVITRNYSEYVTNYEKTFGKSNEIKLPDPNAKDPYINISIPVLIDADRTSLEQTLQKPLGLGGEEQLSQAYERLFNTLAPLETAYKAARDYYFDGDADQDNFAQAQTLHDTMRKSSQAYTQALDGFSLQMRALDKIRRSEKLEVLLKDGMPVHYNVESMQAYAGDIAAFLKDFNDERPYYKGDAGELRPIYDEFAKYADAVLGYTGDDLIKEGFNKDFAHMFPSFFTSVLKMRVTASNILTIMEKQDMNAPLPTLPPDLDNLGMAPEDALSTFSENYSTAGKLYKAFIAEEKEE